MAVLRILSGGGELFDIPFPEGTAQEQAAAAVELLTAGDTGPGRERLAALLEPLFPRRYRRSLFRISGEDARKLGEALLSPSPCPAPAGPDAPREQRELAARMEFTPEELARAVARNAAAREKFRSREKEVFISGGRGNPSGTRANK